MNISQRQIIKYSKGSVTVEACVILPVFLSFFLLLVILIKIACVNIALDHAVNETTKQIAASAYPIAFLNEVEDKILDEYGDKKIEALQERITEINYNSLEDMGESITTDLLSGNFSMSDISNILASDKQGGSEIIKKGLGNFLVELGEDAYWDLKGKGKYIIIKSVMDQFIDEGLINKNNLKFSFVELPQGKAEYEACKRSEAVASTGLIPERDFGMEDVVIQIKYQFKIALPVLGTRIISFKHTAIEKAWLHGGNGIYTSNVEGIKLDNLNKVQSIVYITRTGEKYHRENCRYLRLSKIPVELTDEIKSSYEPCKVCKP